jgi:thymidylate synthase ThyX
MDGMVKEMSTASNYALRVYPMDPKELTEEQIAVTFAMTSRRPEPFDEIQLLVTQDKATDFHEKWVLNYGHASVAEHAVLHMAVENVSRLICDVLEDNRLASYTEKSSRYQVLPNDYYFVPTEVLSNKQLSETYVTACQGMFEIYQQAVDALSSHLSTVIPKSDNERDSAYNNRLRRQATDSARFLLPSSTLTNVGITMNARSMEHAITKLLSGELTEEHLLGDLLKTKGRLITPTLIKYADRSAYLVSTRNRQDQETQNFQTPIPSSSEASLLHYDANAEVKVATSFLYHRSHQPYEDILEHVRSLPKEERDRIIDSALTDLGPHDSPIRELESIYYTFELILDYGAYREFKRHRMQTYIAQPATTAIGYVMPDLYRDAKLEDLFLKGMEIAEHAFETVRSDSALSAQYLVTHAHKRRLITTMNLRECYHLFKLRTQPTAHFSLVSVMKQALEQVQRVHPILFKHLRIRS